MRSAVLAVALLMGAVPAGVMAQPAPVAALPGHYSVENTEIGALLDDPAAKAALDKNIPGFSTRDQIDMARSMTLKSVQQYAPDLVTDQVLVAVQADLNKLPAKKQ